MAHRAEQPSSFIFNEHLGPIEEKRWAPVLPLRQQGRLRRQDLLLLLLGSCRMLHRLKALPATLCSASAPCLLYLDSPECASFAAEEAGNTSAYNESRRFRSVPPVEYIPGFAPRAPQCCNGSMPASLEAYARIRRPNSFFCGRHREETMAAQYRFLPALAHARRYHFRTELWTRAPRGQRHAFHKWVVLLDDDSIVGLHSLLAVLGKHNHLLRIQLGEFIYTVGNATHRIRPYACGGAGTVFSAAAFAATNFGACARAFARI